MKLNHAIPVVLSAFLSVSLPAVVQADAIGVVVQPVEQQSIADPVEALGTLRGNEVVRVTVNVAETVESILFDSGQRVSAGAVLVRLESEEERAVLQEAKYTLDEAQSQLDRIRAVAKRGDASQSLLDEKQREFYVARARVLAIESRLKNREVRAPFSGVVGLRHISPGTYVAPGDVITTLVDDSKLKLDFNVPSLMLSAIRPGVVIQARAKAFHQIHFEGVVESVDNQVDPVSRSVTVRAILDNADGRLKPGLLMEVRLQTNPRSALLIPESALVQERSSHFVYVVDASGEPATVQKREVKLGVRLLGKAEVLQGLAPGDQVVVDGAMKLRHGAEVTLLSQSPVVRN